MSDARVRVGLIGCGSIAGPYVRDLLAYPEIEVAGLADLDPARAHALAEKHGLAAFPSPEALLAQAGLDVAVNLTSHHAHFAVTRACLEAGVHVYSEKPLALKPAEARSLVDLARERGLRLACSPFTALGEAQQTAWQVLRAGRLGRLRLVYAEVNWGRLETWHPEPAEFYRVGPLFDVGVYPLTVLTTLLGPASRVWAYGTVLHGQRTDKQGRPFTVGAPDFVVAMVEFGQGVLARLTTNFYVSTHTRQAGLEFHGNEASLFLESWLNPDSPLYLAEFGKPYAPWPLARPAANGVRWGAGVYELALALRERRPHRLTGEHAAHVVDILCAAAASIESGQPVNVESGFAAPAPMPWAS